MVEVEHIVVPPLVRIEADFDDEKESRRKAVRDIFDRYSVSVDDAKTAEEYINK